MILPGQALCHGREPCHIHQIPIGKLGKLWNCPMKTFLCTTCFALGGPVQTTPDRRLWDDNALNMKCHDIQVGLMCRSPSQQMRAGCDHYEHACANVLSVT